MPSGPTSFPILAAGRLTSLRRITYSSHLAARQGSGVDAAVEVLLRRADLRNPFEITAGMREHVNKLADNLFKDQSPKEIDLALAIIRSAISPDRQFTAQNKNYRGLKISEGGLNLRYSLASPEQPVNSPAELMQNAGARQKATDFEVSYLLVCLLRSANIKAEIQINDYFSSAAVVITPVKGESYLFDPLCRSFSLLPPEDNPKAPADRSDRTGIAWFYYKQGLALTQLSEIKKCRKEPDAKLIGEQAVKRLSAAVELKPGLSAAWSCMGAALKYMGRLSESDDAYAMRHYFEGLEYIEKAEAEKRQEANDRSCLAGAIESFEESLLKNPLFAETWLAKGKAHYKVNEQGKALASIEKALELLEDDQREESRVLKAQALCYKGMLLNWSIDTPPAEKLGEQLTVFAQMLEEVASALSDPKIIKERLFVSEKDQPYNTEKAREAITFFDQALALQPGYAKAWVERGNAYYNLKIADQAILSFKEAIRLQPQNVYAWYQLGMSYLSLNPLTEKGEKAVECLRKALSLKPGYYDRAIYLEGIRFARQRELGKALLCFESLLNSGQEYGSLAWQAKGILIHIKK